MRIARRWLRYVDAPAEEQRAFAKGALYLVKTKIVLAAGGFGFARSVIRDAAAAPGIRDNARARLLGRSVDRASRYLPLHATCLERSVALCWILASEGLGGTLRVGVRTLDDRLDAHAWVERYGEQLLDAGDDFIAFDAPLLGAE